MCSSSAACTSEGCHEIPPTKGANHDPSGRRAFWPVNLIGYTNERRQMIISGGWLAFAEENSLRTGDVCTFELVETNDIVLKVHISRS
ncbi:hypothetical protein C1H46_018522 [Malus baccata]|uniref:TF-B3 domain-containing protein n=1 Tax=Malus baccata TaxID=106549 RepID=A0A540MAV8_MALBA|nr:hypothetical protein C1H46_018522 [Malus baccata]